MLWVCLVLTGKDTWLVSVLDSRELCYRST